jgi:antimicrobial peptide system SdpB family protein
MNKIFSESPYTNVLQIARTVLALGLLLTLVFTDFNHIIIQKINGEFVNPLLNETFLYYKFNLYYLFGYDPFLYKFFSIAIIIFVFSGFLPQISSILHFWLAVSFMLSSSLLDGGDQIHSNLSLLLIPICLCDPRINMWKSTQHNVNIYRIFIGNIFLFLISLQMSAIYFHASVGKYDVLEWANGTAIYYWINHTIFGLPEYLEFINYFASKSWFTVSLTYLTLAIEIVFAGAIFMDRSKRKIIFPIAVIFHISIIFIFGIASFFFSMLAGLILYMLPVSKNFISTKKI